MATLSKYSNMINSDSGQASKVDSVQFSAPESTDFEDDQKKYGSIDPRSDKAVDHKYWEYLLWNCWHLQKGLYYLLHGVRCGGGELTLTKDSLRLLPGEWTDPEWEEIKAKKLNSFRDGLIGILRLTRMGKVSEDDLPAGVFGNGVPVPEAPPVDQGRLFG